MRSRAGKYPLTVVGPGVALVAGALVGVIGDDLNAAYAVFVLIASVSLLWRKDDPPVLPFMLGLQWFSVTAGYWYAGSFGIFPGYLRCRAMSNAPWQSR